MPVVHLIHGFLGAGKTTFSRRLAHETGALRFSPDERMTQLHGDDPPADRFSLFHASIMAGLETEWIAAIRSGHDVILDYGFWTRAERDAIRHRISTLAASPRLYDVRCPEATARQRIRLRNTDLRGSLIVTDATYDLLCARFQSLQSDEPHTVIDNKTGNR